jgi:hypothetical protein
MIFSIKARRFLLKAFTVLSALATCYHLAGAIFKIDESPVWRHLLFTGITIFCFYGFRKRPRYFVILFAVLLVQQYYSHGTYMYDLWVNENKVHWISIFDLLLLPLAFICLVEDAKMRFDKAH